MGTYNAAADSNSYEAMDSTAQVRAILEQRKGADYTPSPGNGDQVVEAIQQHIPDYQPVDYAAEREQGQAYDSSAQNEAIWQNVDSATHGARDQATNFIGSVGESDMTGSESNTREVAGTNGRTYDLTQVGTTVAASDQAATDWARSVGPGTYQAVANYRLAPPQASSNVLNFVAEVSGYNDAVRALTGTDPSTGKDLSFGQRVGSGLLAAVGFVPIGRLATSAERAGAAAIRAGRTATRSASRAVKDFDWQHIFDNHADWGNTARQRKAAGGVNSTFFDGLSEGQIKARVQSAWSNRSKVSEIQRDLSGTRRQQYQGYDPSSGQYIEFWQNLDSGVVETAYPVFGKSIRIK